jgi:hypothetical protein
MTREFEGRPALGQNGLGGGADLRDLIAIENLKRGLNNDQRNAMLGAAREGRDQRKEQTVMQDRRMEQAAPFMQTMGQDFPGMEGVATPFFQQSSKLGVDPVQAYQMLAGTYETMRKSDDATPLFTVAGQPVTKAQAIAILNGEKPFDNWMRLKWAGKDLYEEAKRVAALRVQELALQGFPR